jgi:hypothetical protein
MPRHPPCALLRLISNSIYWRTRCLRSGARHSLRRTRVAVCRTVLIPHTRSVVADRPIIHPSIVKERVRPRPHAVRPYRTGRPALRAGLPKKRCELEMRECGRLPRLFRRRPEGRRLLEISRKEVIQPQVPLRLPCYDFAPVTELTFDGCLLAVSPPASGPPSFHGVTGGVYKARERIHRGVADPRLLAIPASCSRVADCNPNLDRLLAIGAPSRVGDALYRPL